MGDSANVQVRLSNPDQGQLDELLRGGLQPVRTVLRALVLRQLADGQTIRKVARNVGLNPEDGLADQPTLSARRTRSGLIRGGAAGEGSVVGCPTAAAHRGSGLQSATGGPGAVDSALASGGGGETQTGAASGTRDGPHPARTPRSKTVAGKKCGAWPNSMSNTSRAWRMYWQSMRSRSRPGNQWCVSTRNRWFCFRKSGLR